MVPQLRDHLLYIFIYMPSRKYPIFNKSKNPFVKNTKSISSISKKGSVMVDENNTGILSPTITIENYYYDLGYYNIENNSTYYEDSVTSTTNIFHVNYIQDTKNKLNI